MNFAFYEPTESYDAPDFYDFEPSFAAANLPSKNEAVKLFTDKFLAPPLKGEIDRPRLIEHLQKSLAQFSTTIINGRAGTGKTVLAAQYAAQSDAKICRYKVETADADWKIFASYLLGSLDQTDVSIKFDGREVAAQSEQIAAKFAAAAEQESLLIVLDDLHSVFDAAWFADFFHAFVPSLPPNVEVLLIARTLPPLAVWRLRSKQVLGVVEEKSLAFTLEETVNLFYTFRLTPKAACAAHQSSYGKISKLVEIAEKKSALQNQLV